MSIEPIGDIAPNIGHNSGAEASDLIERTLRRSDEIERGAASYLATENADLMRRLKDLEALIARGLPEAIASKADAEKLSDVQFAIKKWVSAAKSARTAAKRPWDAIAKSFYAFFTRPIENLEKIADERIAPVLADWQEREADRIRREEAERARILREEAERQAREAREAEARRMEAERREREAKEAAERAERERLEAIDRAKRAKAEAEEQERRAAEAKREADARAKREAEEKAERDARRKAEEEAAALRRAEFKRQEDEAKAAAAKALAERREAEKAAAAAKKEIRAETRNETEAAEAATRADKKADKSETRANETPAALSRVRGEAGSVSSLRTYWTFRNLDRRTVNLEALRHHLPVDGLESAVRSYIAAGGRELAGVEIFEDSQTVTR